MIKVLLVSNMYAYPGNWDKLDELGRYVELEVVTPARWATTRELHPVDDVREDGERRWVHHPLPTITQGNPFRYLYRPLALIRVLRAFRPDVVHVEQEPESLSLLQLSLLKPWFGYRLLFVAWENINPLRLGWAFRRLNFAFADGAIFGNRAALRRGVELGFRRPHVLTPQYGFAVAGPPPARPRSTSFSVGYAGRLVPEKGIRDLLDAVHLLPGVELVVAGDGPLADEVRRDPRVRWLGRLDRTTMAAFWEQVDALAVPSRTTRRWAEQFGRVIVEAMAHGVPVIGSSSGAIPEVIDDVGLVFPEGDVAELAAALERLRSDGPLRERLTAQGYGRVERVYHYDVVMPATVEFYEEILRARPAAVRDAP
jgi:glycosyltransferase involved in cell wall biosynthesis